LLSIEHLILEEPTVEEKTESTTDLLWQQGSLIPLKITALATEGEGLGHYQGRVVFVPNTVPGDQVIIRLLRVKREYGSGVIHQMESPSPHRIRAACLVSDKCGGCQWQPIQYALQLQTKQNTVQEALERIGKLKLPPSLPILGAEQPLRYRNKVIYPLQQGKTGLRMGYYQPGSHRLINLNQCPVQDQRLDPFLNNLKHDFQKAGWIPYDEKTHQGSLRHVSLRIGRRTGEILLTLISRDLSLPGLESWAQTWLTQYPGLVGVCLNHNPQRTNTLFGSKTNLIAGQKIIRERFLGLLIAIDSTSFFQIYTEQAEAFFGWILDQMHLQGSETVVDAYCGIGTLTLPLAQRVKQVIGIDSLAAAIQQAQYNAEVNQIKNAHFLEGRVETLLPTLDPADIVLLDPPRKGCGSVVLEALLHQHPRQIIYISCHAATQARDLQILLAQGTYEVKAWRAADFFPQTSHVESVVFLDRKNII
jgi:23S rRNA (uracil1939-C5)-methyltransferase